MRTSKPEIDLSLLKPGSVLIAQEFWNNELFNRSVILILKHDQQGSAGIILNKSEIIAGKLNLYCNYMQPGEAFDLNNTGITYKLKRISNNPDISEIYNSKNLHELRNMIPEDQTAGGNPNGFIVLTAWEPGQLEQQVLDKKWWVQDFSVNELYEEEGIDLWKYKLIKSRNFYGLFSEMSDPIMN